MSDVQYPQEIMLYGYTFRFLQLIEPEKDAQGRIWLFYPQKEYRNRRGLALSKYGRGAFCRFSIQPCDEPGVYLLVTNVEIIYIGQCKNLTTRFNAGYGFIQPRGCFTPGGNSTNCKINKAILRLSVSGKSVALYFFRSPHRHKQVERKLLERIRTKLNGRA